MHDVKKKTSSSFKCNVWALTYGCTNIVRDFCTLVLHHVKVRSDRYGPIVGGGEHGHLTSKQVILNYLLNNHYSHLFTHISVSDPYNITGDKKEPQALT